MACSGDLMPSGNSRLIKAAREALAIAKGENQPASRDATAERISALAGLDVNGAILPPEPGMGINRESVRWWESQNGTASVFNVRTPGTTVNS